jgi:hypothetical protein
MGCQKILNESYINNTLKTLKEFNGVMTKQWIDANWIKNSSNIKSQTKRIKLRTFWILNYFILKIIAEIVIINFDTVWDIINSSW